MLHLLHTGFGDFAFTRRRLVSLLDEAVQHDDSPTDKGAKKHPRNSFGPLQSKLEQPFPEGFGVWLSEVGAERNHTTSQHDVQTSRRGTHRKILSLLPFGMTVDGFTSTTHLEQAGNSPFLANPSARETNSGSSHARKAPPHVAAPARG